MKPGKAADVKEEIVEVHMTARSPSPKQKSKTRSRSRSGSRKLSNGHPEVSDDVGTTDEISVEKLQSHDTWIKSEHESLDIELPIHDQIKQGILGFVEKEFKKTDKSPSFVFYSHDPNGLDEKYLKNLSRPSSGHKEKRSPSYRKKKRHSSRHRDKEQQDFEIPGSSLSALEKVDDYLKEYNKDEVVTLSGELEIEVNDLENNNSSKGSRHKSRRSRRKLHDEKYESNGNKRDVSPKVFKSSKTKHGKPARPTNLTDMLERLESNVPYHDQYIDNPFSSPSPLTSPNDERMNPFAAQRPQKIYLQGGGTFKAVARDRILDPSQSRENKYLRYRFSDLTPVDIALKMQRAWRSTAPACHGILGGLSLMHLLLIGYSDGMDSGHLSFHAVVTMPYVSLYYFFCVLCMVSVLDRLDITSIDHTLGVQPYFQPLVLVILYMACLLVCTSARMYDEMIVYNYDPMRFNLTSNFTMAPVPTFYNTWTHFSIWRAVLSILGLIYFVLTDPADAVCIHTAKLLQFKQTLQSIG